MTQRPAVPACPLCGGASWRRESFHALEASRPTPRVVVRARCRGCGVRRFFAPEGETLPACAGVEGSADPVAFLTAERDKRVPYVEALANGACWFGTGEPGGRRWLFDPPSLARALAAAGWTNVKVHGAPWSRTLRVVAR